MTTPLEDIFIKRMKSTSFSGLSHNFIEFFGGQPVSFSQYDPDPNTHRESFYYNTRENRLFKKVKASDGQYVWKDVSEC